MNVELNWNLFDISKKKSIFCVEFVPENHIKKRPRVFLPKRHETIKLFIINHSDVSKMPETLNTNLMKHKIQVMAALFTSDTFQKRFCQPHLNLLRKILKVWQAFFPLKRQIKQRIDSISRSFLELLILHPTEGTMMLFCERPSVVFWLQSSPRKNAASWCSCATNNGRFFLSDAKGAPKMRLLLLLQVVVEEGTSFEIKHYLHLSCFFYQPSAPSLDSFELSARARVVHWTAFFYGGVYSVYSSPHSLTLAFFLWLMEDLCDFFLDHICILNAIRLDYCSSRQFSEEINYCSSNQFQECVWKSTGLFVTCHTIGSKLILWAIKVAFPVVCSVDDHHGRLADYCFHSSQ